jgi:hypothetical protein
MGSFMHSTQLLIVFVLSVGAFTVEVWAFVCALKAPSGAYALAGRLSKRAWVGITAAAAAIGLAALPTPFLAVPFGGILSIAAIVAALVFLVGVRPKVRGPRRPPASPGARGSW